MNSQVEVSKFFKDSENQKSFENNGFIKLNIADSQLLDKLQILFDTYFSDIKVKQFTYSNQIHNRETNFIIQEKIKEILTPILNIYLQNFKIVLGLYYIKPTGNKSNFYLHRDWSIVDESQYSSLNFWLPLEVTNKENGNLVVYPGTHKKNTWRGSPVLSFPKESMVEKILSKFNKMQIYNQKGEAVLFDHRLLHSSNNNISGKARVVAALSLIPNTAKMIHYHQLENGKVAKYEVEDDFYLFLDSNMEENKKVKFIEYVDFAT